MSAEAQLKRVSDLSKKLPVWKGQNTVMRGFLQLYQSKPPDLPVLEARITKYNLLYDNFETLMDELDTLDQEGQYHKLDERYRIEATYYEILAEAERTKNPRPPTPTVSGLETIVQTVSGLSTVKHRVKLPDSKLPSFDGNIGQYISWKTAFNSMIGEREDVDFAAKLIYIKSSLTGTAAKKIEMLAITEENYTRAWDILDKAYADERVIISSHLQSLLSLPRQDKDDGSSLSNLVDATRQHLESLQSMKINVGEHMIVALLERRVAKATLEAWDEKQERGKFPKLEDMLEFLSRRASRLINRAKTPLTQSSVSAKQNPQKTTASKKSTQAFTITQGKACPACQDTQHFSIYRCEKFKAMPVTQRVKIANEAKVCLNCLNYHGKIPCRYGPCKHCPEYHNTLLHPEQNNSSRATVMTARTLSNQLMTTAIIHVLDKSQRAVKCRVLLDTGASSNFMTERLANILNLPRKSYKIPIETLHELNTFTKDVVTATIQSTQSQYSMELSFLTVPRIANNIPMEAVSRESINIPKNIHLADPEFYLPAPVDLLIGTGPTLDLLSIGQIKLSSPNSPPLSLQKTQLGWIIGGTMPTGASSYSPARCYLTSSIEKKEDTNFELQRFWEIEEGPQEKHLSKEEHQAVEHFKETFIRDNTTGRYTVALPFNGKQRLLGDSYSMALKRYYALERKFNRDPELKQQYTANIQEYLQLNYLTEVKDASKSGFYLPHHAVVKKDSIKTKVRVVYDASAKSTSNISLNDCLMVGPSLQADIFWLVLQFRCHKYVLTGDIEKMYLQFLIKPEDREYQKILWKKDNGGIATFQLNNVTFGLASSPFQAVQCLHQLADDEAHRYPQAAQILKTNVYMDDLLTGFETIQGGIQARESITNLLKSGGLNIRHWASNDNQLLQGLPTEAIHQTLQLDDGATLKTLGVFWDAQSDSIVYTVKPVTQRQKVSKRFILSEVAKIYDPLGLLGPVILSAKIIIQKLWQNKSGWDESVPIHIHTEWIEFCSELNTLNQVSFPRYTFQSNATNIQIHGFCDASNAGYGACLYIVSSDAEGNTQSHLFCAKSRVAPLKLVDTPRLELCSAQLLAKLYTSIKTTIKVPVERTILWSDSMITLHWINTSSHLLKTFVANRVANIQEVTQGCEWRHVPGVDNPADALSRGQTPSQFIQNTLWKKGPAWLIQGQDVWPADPLVQPETDKEAKKVICCKAIIKDTPMAPINFEKYSLSMHKLKRIVAYCLRFKVNNRFKGQLQLQELQKAEKAIVRAVQQDVFQKEIKQLQEGELSPRSELLPLAPRLDKQDGLLRVGGRLKNSTLHTDEKCPIILPKRHPVTTLIIRREHLLHGHAGPMATLYATRQRYWIFHGRNEVRRILQQCVTCAKMNAPTVNYPMADLPAARITQARPFSRVGVDYCGPFEIKEKKYRNRGRVKSYVAVFVCLVSRAIHLELVSDMTTAGFLAALRRFIGRRGLCQLIQSDNGTNFVGAKNELAEITALLQSDTHHDSIISYLNERGIQWKMIPPASPHFGGIWEAAVKSFKYHLRRVAGQALFTFEEFNTVIIEIEAILNSRPITPISSDPNDLLVLTPGHFLIGEALTSPPEQDLTEVASNRLSNWERITQVKQHFWQRWYKEYLGELNVRRKWTKGHHDITVGSIVLIKEDNLKPMQWRIARVIELHPGSDGIVRVATLKTSTGVLKRTVKKLAPLPVLDSTKLAPLPTSEANYIQENKRNQPESG